MGNRQGFQGRLMFRRLPLLLATGFHLGRIPYAPGTVGSLAAFVMFLPIRHLSWMYHLSIVAVIVAVGVFAAERARAVLAVNDPPAVIIDEIAGCWVAVVGIAPRPAPLLCAVALFRLFDIWKPYPIDRLEALPGGWGIMLDDLAAGISANLLVRLLQLWMPNLIG